MVLVPFLIHTGVPEKACVQLSHLNESVTLSATLEFLGENSSLITEEVSAKNVFKCISFTVPKTSKSSVAFLTVLVKGPTLEFRSRKSVLIENPESLVFIQTDKPIYKPGQKVQFRIVSLDEDFHPLNEQFPLVYIQDPQRNRLSQWRGVELQGGLTQLFFPLTSEPIQGTYKVVVQRSSGRNVEHPFAVEEYVLPKYEVLVKVPKTISILDEELKVSVCGLYTYGKPVPGLVNVRVCRSFSSHSSECYGKEEKSVCEEFTRQADAKGCAAEVLKTKVFHLLQKRFEMSIDVQGKITEEGTGIELTGKGSTAITKVLSTVTFEQMDSYYKPGIPFFGQVRLVDGKEAPIANETVRISVDGTNYEANITTGEDGRVPFSIDTTNLTVNSINMQAQHKSQQNCYDSDWHVPQHNRAYHRTELFYSPSKSYLKIEPVFGTLSCDHTQAVRVHYILKALGEQEEVTFYYLVMAKGGIVKAGTRKQAVVPGDAKGIFTLFLRVGPSSAPLTRLLIYTTFPTGEVVANSADFQVENCFANKVDLHFTPAEGLPATATQLQLVASPGSLCAIRAVDKSVLIMKPEAELSPKSVYDLLPVKDLRGYNYREHYLDQEDSSPCLRPGNIFLNGFLYSPISAEGEGDTYKILKEMGLKVFTSTQVHKPELCEMRGYPEYAYASSGLMRPGVPSSARTFYDAPENEAEAAAAVVVRKYFPETWIWDVVTANSSGGAEVAVTIPDTITEWKAGAFCTSGETGFGLSPTTSLRAFQPFFLQLTLPYSVVRGEAFTLKATVFSYLTRCIRVSVSLAPSPDFVAAPLEEEEESYCVCMNGRKTVSWSVTPKSLGEVSFTVSAEALQSDLLCGNEIVETPERGRKDTVIRQLLVEPEGIEREVTFNALLCGAEKSVPQPVSLKLPLNVVEGSARAYFSVLGDILGTAMQNLQQLLQMPYGCGEQNMVLFAPNIYILDYLNKTGQLTEETKSKAIGYLVSGYQRQLNYKHRDGSYSTFGERYLSPGNTWLTAFVLKSLSQAQTYIFVDENHITDALAWLSSRQKENGCFRSSGTLLNNAIKGGVQDEVTLSAYNLIALLEIPLPLTHSVVRNALFCLETAVEAGDVHVYTKALVAYAFALAGREEKRRALLDSLDKEAVKEDGSVHWQRPEKQQETDHLLYQPRAPSAEVEMTSYVLLAYLTTRPAPSQADLTAASLIVRWLSKQQNPNGGFSSTQDTVVALQGLAQYGTSTYAGSGGVATVTLQSGGNPQVQFQVDASNRLLLQRMTLPTVPGEYSTRVAGEGCVYTQTSLRYNVHVQQEQAPFALKVHTVPDVCDGAKAHRTFDINVNISYTGKRPISNMAIVDVKMPSGFIAVKSSVKKLVGHGQVKRTEVNTNHVLLYLEQVSNVTQSYSFAVEQDLVVQSQKPALVKVYDYYETDEYAATEYSTPCSTATEQGNA